VPALDFRILGALEVSADGGAPIDLGGGKQRALLAALLVHANEVVASDRLVDYLWGEHPPATAPKALQVHVSQLRKQLGEGVVETCAPGYLLRADDDQLDARRFEALLEDATRATDPAAALDALTRALGQWRGAALADVAYEPFAEAEAGRLEELRLTAVERRVDALLALGRTDEAIGELHALVAHAPLRERPRAQLITALYRAGRQAEALDAYREAQDELMELGLEPTAELRDLQRAVLNQDASLDLPPEPAGSAPEVGGSGTFVGRSDELARIRTALDGALAGSGALVLIGGEPGIGKSRLLSHVADDADARGARPLWGRAWEAGGAPAYWTWLTALRELADLPHAAALDEVVPGAAAAGDESESARIRLFDAACAFLVDAAAKQPLAVLLDDIHAADTPSLLLLQFLARRLPRARLLVVAAYRDVAGGPGEALSRALVELSREERVVRLSLAGLEPEEVSRYIDLATGVHVPDVAAERIHADTAGNPLFLGELVRLLEAEGKLGDVADQDAPRVALPEGVRDVIAARLDRLSDDCVRVLTLASVIGRRFTLDTLERVVSLPADRLLDVLDEAAEARVVTAVDRSARRLQFSHALVRDALYDRLGPGRRARLHHAIGDALEQVYAPDPGPHLAELALHFTEAASRGDVEKGVDYARRAADRAGALLAFEEAARLYDLALRSLALADADDPDLRCELLLSRGEVLMRAGDADGAKSAFLEAADLARAAGRAEPLGRAALGYGGRLLWGRGSSDPTLVPLLEEALEQLRGDSALRARLLGRLASAIRDEPSRARRQAVADEALAIARRVGDTDTLAYALETHWEAIESADTIAARGSELGELLALAEATGDPERLFIANELALGAAFQVGDVDAVERHLAAMSKTVSQLRQPAHEWLLGTYRSMFPLLRGEFDVAEQVIDETFERGRRALTWNAIVSHRLLVFFLRREQGRLAELEDVIARSIDEYPTLIRFRCMLADIYADQGRQKEALAACAPLIRDDLAEWHMDAEWLLAVALLADVVAALGDRRGAEVLHGVLTPYARHNAMAHAEVAIGAVARPLGRLAGLLGRFDEAERHFAFAVEMNDRLGARPWTAHSKHDHAAMLLARGADGDAERAGGLLTEAIAAYDALGMSVWSERAAALRPRT
jgi:DNA-binding SARP family transcriptional activator